jgi:hypothetical protein
MLWKALNCLDRAPVINLKVDIRGKADTARTLGDIRLTLGDIRLTLAFGKLRLICLGAERREAIMSAFRRLVIGVAEVVQVISIVVVTLGGGMLGRSLMVMYSLRPFTAQQVQSGQVTVAGSVPMLGFIIGATIGFCLAATAAAILFTLAEIASNTRQIPLDGWGLSGGFFSKSSPPCGLRP